MLKNYEQKKLSEYEGIYEIVVKKDNLLRIIKENIDFSFINAILKESYCEHLGRPATEPELMFKQEFLKKLYDLSDEVLIENVEVNMAYKYFLGMNPEDKPVHSSLMTKFRKNRITEEILEEILSEIVKQAIEKGIIKSSMIIVDATHSRTNAKQETPTQILRRLTKELRKEIYLTQYEISGKFPEKPTETAELSKEIEYSRELLSAVKQAIIESGSKKAKKAVEKITELLEDEKIKEIQSLADEDAKSGHKSENNHFFGYKTHIAMTEERIITGLETTTGEASDGKHLQKIVEQSKANGIDVKEVCGDSAYPSKDNLEYAKKNEIKLISKMNSTVSSAINSERNDFVFNKDADTFQCPAGYLSIRKAKTKQNNGKENKNRNPRIKYYFDVEKCQTCPLREGCYKDGAKTKTYSITIPSQTHKEQKAFQETEYFKSRIKQRYMIEGG
jgi:transposase